MRIEIRRSAYDGKWNFDITTHEGTQIATGAYFDDRRSAIAMLRSLFRLETVNDLTDQLDKLGVQTVEAPIESTNTVSPAKKTRVKKVSKYFKLNERQATELTEKLLQVTERLQTNFSEASKLLDEADAGVRETGVWLRLDQAYNRLLDLMPPDRNIDRRNA